jgi:hypothetical protein
MLAPAAASFALSNLSDVGDWSNAAMASGAESFAAVLSAAESGASAVGSGPQSAEPHVVGQAERLKSDFRQWRAEFFQRGISNDRRQGVLQHSAEFEQLIDKAVAQNAYADPQAFLQSLSTDELKVVQEIHGLAESIVPAGLSEEGALNLLLSPDSSRDIDRDGFQMVGLGKKWQFPPVNAPESVKQAWKEATANMSESEVMLLQGSFLPFVIDGVTNNSAYISPDADYRDIVQKTIDHAEIAKRYDKPWQLETRDRQIEFLETLLSKLQVA